MKRWIPTALVALLLLIANVAGRWLNPQGNDAETYELQTMVGVLATAAMTLVALLAGVWWSVKKQMQRIIPELGLGLLFGTLLAVFIGPLLAGANPVAGGFGLVTAEILMFFGVMVIGAFLGFMVATALGIDYRSKGLKRIEKHYGSR